MIEVHNDPPNAMSDGPQSVTPEEFSDIAAAGRIRFARCCHGAGLNHSELTIGIAGLGLIGGSLAKAYKRAQIKAVYGCDRETTLFQGIAQAGQRDRRRTKRAKRLHLCDAILIAIYPSGCHRLSGKHR